MKKQQLIYFIAFIITIFLNSCKKDKMDSLLTRKGGWDVEQLFINGADSTNLYNRNSYYCKNFYFGITNDANHDHIFSFGKCDSSNWGGHSGWKFSGNNKQLGFAYDINDIRFIYGPIGYSDFWDILELKDGILQLKISYLGKTYELHLKGV